MKIFKVKTSWSFHRDKVIVITQKKHKQFLSKKKPSFKISTVYESNKINFYRIV